MFIIEIFRGLFGGGGFGREWGRFKFKIFVIEDLWIYIILIGLVFLRCDRIILSLFGLLLFQIVYSERFQVIWVVEQSDIICLEYCRMKRGVISCVELIQNYFN